MEKNCIFRSRISPKSEDKWKTKSQNSLCAVTPAVLEDGGRRHTCSTRCSTLRVSVCHSAVCSTWVYITPQYITCVHTTLLCVARYVMFLYVWKNFRGYERLYLRKKRNQGKERAFYLPCSYSICVCVKFRAYINFTIEVCENVSNPFP